MPIDPSAPTDKPETDQMKVIHNALRREFALLAHELAGVSDGDAPRAALVAGHATLMLAMLHEHHESEDELLWPLLRERVPLRADLLTTIEQQHNAIAELVDQLQANLTTWRKSGAASVRAALVSQAKRLGVALDEHLDLEEREILPLIHEHLTVPEWEAPQRAAARRLPSGFRDRMILTGAVLEDATPAEQAWFLRELPPPARVLWRLVGRRMYTAQTRAVRKTGSTRP